jgi:hypothetical protein
MDYYISAAPRMALQKLQILWVNTGTLCNLACTGCFMESTPVNDALAYFPLPGFLDLLDDAPEEIGFTGGEPFMNPDLLAMLQATLASGRRALVLTNAMRPMMRLAAPLEALVKTYGGRLIVRVSLDHYRAEKHDELRGAGSFAFTMGGLKFLADIGARLAVACRTPWCDSKGSLRTGFAALFSEHGIPLNAGDEGDLVLFPEMNAARPACEVTATALRTLKAPPMCATSRMVVHRKGADGVRFTPCTLLPDRDLASMTDEVVLDHPYCSQFCVYGGASCAG